MSTVKQQLAELSALAQIYILQNYGLKDWLLAESSSYQFFRQQVQAQKVKQTKPQDAVKGANPGQGSPFRGTETLDIGQGSPGNPNEAGATKQVRPGNSNEALATVQASPNAVLDAQGSPGKDNAALSIGQDSPNDPIQVPSGKATLGKTEKPKEFFTLEPMSVTSPPDVQDIRAFMGEKFPKVKILDHLPRVDEALPRLSAGVVVLSFQENGMQRIFLEQITHAISRSLVPAELRNAHDIERRQEWETLFNTPEIKLIVACVHGMHHCPDLMKYYREDQRKGQIFFGKVPALVLTDLSVYLKEPQLKASLWKSLKETIHVR